MSKVIFLGFLALFPFILSSCVMDDSSKCKPDSAGVKLGYEYTLNNQYTDKFDSEVSKVTIYIFDKAGFYYDTYQVTTEELAEGNIMDLPLIADKYTLLIWGGNMDSYTTATMIDEQSGSMEPGLQQGKTTIDTFRLVLKQDDPSGIISDKFDDLYYARQEIEFGKTDTNYRINLLKNTNKIKLSIYGFKSLDSNSFSLDSNSFDVSITADNSCYTAHNNIGSSAQSIKYLPSSVTGMENGMEYDLRTLRMVAGKPMKLTVNHLISGQVIADFDLVDYILALEKYNTQEDLDREDEYHVELKIGPDMSIQVSVNGWIVDTIIPKL